MSLIENIKFAQITARKNRHADAIASLTTLIGEAEMIGKNAGRDVTDQEVVALTKKFIKNNRETAAIAGIEVEKLAALDVEHSLFTQYLPQQLSAQELDMAIKNIVGELQAGSSKVDMGNIMKVLKERFDGQYDGRAASQMIKTAIQA